jgi:hypothetical protein
MPSSECKSAQALFFNFLKGCFKLPAEQFECAKISRIGKQLIMCCHLIFSSNLQTASGFQLPVFHRVILHPHKSCIRVSPGIYKFRLPKIAGFSSYSFSSFFVRLFWLFSALIRDMRFLSSFELTGVGGSSSGNLLYNAIVYLFEDYPDFALSFALFFSTGLHHTKL